MSFSDGIKENETYFDGERFRLPYFYGCGTPEDSRILEDALKELQSVIYTLKDHADDTLGYNYYLERGIGAGKALVFVAHGDSTYMYLKCRDRETGEITYSHELSIEDVMQATGRASAPLEWLKKKDEDIYGEIKLHGKVNPAYQLTKGNEYTFLPNEVRGSPYDDELPKEEQISHYHKRRR